MNKNNNIGFNTYIYNLKTDLIFYSVMRRENIQLEGPEWEEAVKQLEREYETTYAQIVRYEGETTAIISVLDIRISRILGDCVTVVD